MNSHTTAAKITALAATIDTMEGTKSTFRNSDTKEKVLASTHIFKVIDEDNMTELKMNNGWKKAIETVTKIIKNDSSIWQKIANKNEMVYKKVFGTMEIIVKRDIAHGRHMKLLITNIDDFSIMLTGWAAMKMFYFVDSSKLLKKNTKKTSKNNSAALT